MISFDMKSEKTSSSPLSLSTPSEKPTLSFSELLRGVSENKDAKVIQNGSLVLSLGANEKDAKDGKDVKGASKADALLSLLKNEDTLPLQTKEEPLELNPKITANLTTKEIKALVSDAKNYLKAKIEASDDYKKSQIKDLPKTLKGLVEAAKKFGIDINKISIEEVKAHADAKVLTAKETVVDKKIETKEAKEIVVNKKIEAKQIKEVVVDKKIEEQQIKEVVVDKKVEVKQIKEVKQVKEIDKKAEVQQVKEIDKKVDVQQAKEIDKKVDVQQAKEIPHNKKIETASEKEAKKITTSKSSELPQQALKEIQDDDKVHQTVKATPLFKPQAVVEHTTTEQLVQVKVNNSFKVEQKTPKDRADETLKLLLRGEKPSLFNPSLTADFSVATAKVIAPTAVSDATKAIEKLLHGDSSKDNGASASSKGEALAGVHKAESFEVKLNEAKQMIKYLSSDVKTAIEDYKSPFTRIKLQLNPQRLGEVDLTIVQRGKNLHVNISSNNTAVNTLAMNANELRVQLNNSGINNATLNFNNHSQNSDSGAGQQQQNQHKQKEAHEEYGILNKFENDEANEDILSSLEIIVPHYV